MFGFFGKENKRMPRLVVGLNQVDKIVPRGWDERLNTPTEVAEGEIERRCGDIIAKLSESARIDKSQIEFYSALKRYRLIPLIGTITRFAFAGFKFDNIQPADPFEMADKDVQEFVAEERVKRSKGKSKEVASKDLLFDELQKHLTKEELNEVKQKFSQERQRPPKVAIFGKAGVGKTTTVNSLFNAHWKTSHTVVGTTKAQMKEFTLADGGILEIVDLPGYGVSTREDAENEKIYQQFIPSCDIVLLVLQANSRDFTDDQEMLSKAIEWLQKSPVPER